MGYDKRTAERVRNILAERTADFCEKRMVGGGLSFMVHGSMCCGVSKDALMIRVGPATYELALTRPHTRPLTFAGKAPIGYICVAPEGFEEEAELRTWVQQGIDFTATISPGRPRSRAATSSH